MRDPQLKKLSEDIKKDFQESLGYKRFNRHEVFTMEDTSFVLELISKVVGNHSIKNMLYGLFDGYLYEELMYDLYSKTDISGKDLYRLETILLKVDDHLSEVLTK